MANGTIKMTANESGPGYCKMPDGLMFQWGVQSVRTASTGGAYGYYGNAAFNFPIPFVGDAPSCFVNVGEYAAFWGGSIHSITLTGATASIGGNQNSTTKPVYWFAVGRWK